MKTQICPNCGETVVWDETHLPHAWRHEHDSRWCELKAGDPGPSPHYPKGATDPNRQSGVTNPELWKELAL